CLLSFSAANIILWRNQKISAGIFAGTTVIWLLFEGIGYHLLTFVCHSLTLSFATLFLWSNLASFFNIMVSTLSSFIDFKSTDATRVGTWSLKPAIEFPKVTLPEDLFVKIALLLRSEFNRASATFPDVASGNDLKKFLAVIVVLWALSVVGSWFSFLTLFYLGGFLSSLFYVFVMLLTVPMLYEKHEDAGDAYAGKSLAEIKSQYAVIDEKVLQKLPASLFHHKQH
ncbi:hypothetical protein SCA6_009821, partial [Theobroma cacao]